MASAAPAPLLFLLLFFGFVSLGKPDLDGDKAALLALRSAVGRFLPWNPSDPTPCSWQGVTCENSRVTVLRLPGVGLIGDLPSGSLGGLTALRTLSLRWNAISGTLPPDFAELTDLHNLFLQKNRFSGSIPPAIFSLKNLVRLDLAGNNFSGEIPSSFNNLTRLNTLRLESNALVGSIPDLNLINLVPGQFNVSFNRLNGSIPASLSRLGSDAFLGNLALCGLPLAPCPTTPEGKRRKLSGGAIAGIVIACAVVAVFILYICLACSRKKRNGHRRTEAIDVVALKQTPVDSSPAHKAAGGEEAIIGAAGVKEEFAAAGEREIDVMGGAGGKKLVFFAGANRGFDLEDLLRSSAEVLGKGTFGTAYKAVLDGGNMVAVKRLKDVIMGQREFTLKIDKIGTMVHENLVPLRAYYYSKEEKLLVYDYMSMGSLSAFLHGARGSGKTPLNWQKRSRIALGAARGIEYLHSQGPSILHGNLKSSNVLLTKDFDGCVSDFGLATLVTSASATNRVIGYRAPEVADSVRISQKADVYSYGVLLLELLTGKPPADALLNEEGVDLPRWVRSVVREKWASEVFDLELLRDQDVEEAMVQLMQIALDCVATYPGQRPTMGSVVRRMEDLLGADNTGHETDTM